VDTLPKATSVDEAARAAKVAVLPVGSFEQHGRHLPLATDTMIAYAIAEAIASQYDLALLPPITIACSHEHAAFAGTVSISAATLHALITDIAASLEGQGIHKLVLVNGHGGNYVLGNVVQEANVGGAKMALFPHRDDWDRARKAAGLVTSAHEDMHGGELETSIMLAVAPERVSDRFEEQDWIASDRTHLHLAGIQAYTSTGIVGRPSLATVAKGHAALEELVRAFQSHLRLLVAFD